MFASEVLEQRGIHFGQYLIERGLVSEDDVISALEMQSKNNIPFEKAAIAMQFLNMKQIYKILTYQIDTDLSFSEVAEKKGYLRRHEINLIHDYVSKNRLLIGDILVQMKKLTRESLKREIEGFDKLTKYYQKAAKMLKKITVFSKLNPNTLLTLSYISSMKKFSPNKIIIKEGDSAEHFFCVVSGTLRVTKDNPQQKGKDIYITNIGEGEVFGEACIFEGGKRTANITAETETIVLMFYRYDFIEFIKNNHKAALNFLLLIIQRLMGRLENANKELAYDRKESSTQDEIDKLIDDLSS